MHFVGLHSGPRKGQANPEVQRRRRPCQAFNHAGELKAQPRHSPSLPPPDFEPARFDAGKLDGRPPCYRWCDDGCVFEHVDRISRGPVKNATPSLTSKLGPCHSRRPATAAALSHGPQSLPSPHTYHHQHQQHHIQPYRRVVTYCSEFSVCGDATRVQRRAAAGTTRHLWLGSTAHLDTAQTAVSILSRNILGDGSRALAQALSKTKQKLYRNS